MIIYLHRGATEFAVKVKDLNTGAQLVSCEGVYLLVHPGQKDNPCWEGGSPWILEGCWPMGQPTGVDIANPGVPNIPTLRIPAFRVDEEGRIVFRILEMADLPVGRYTAEVVVMPPQSAEPFRGLVVEKTPGVARPPDRLVPLMVGPDPTKVILPPGYEAGRECTPTFPSPPPPPRHPEPCVLLTIDIDLGPLCGDHYASQIDLTPQHETCGDCNDE